MFSRGGYSYWETKWGILQQGSTILRKYSYIIVTTYLRLEGMLLLIEYSMKSLILLWKGISLLSMTFTWTK